MNSKQQTGKQVNRQRRNKEVIGACCRAQAMSNACGCMQAVQQLQDSNTSLWQFCSCACGYTGAAGLQLTGCAFVAECMQLWRNAVRVADLGQANDLKRVSLLLCKRSLVLLHQLLATLSLRIDIPTLDPGTQ